MEIANTLVLLSAHSSHIKESDEILIFNLIVRVLRNGYSPWQEIGIDEGKDPPSIDRSFKIFLGYLNEVGCGRPVNVEERIGSILLAIVEDCIVPIAKDCTVLSEKEREE